MGCPGCDGSVLKGLHLWAHLCPCTPNVQARGGSVGRPGPRLPVRVQVPADTVLLKWLLCYRYGVFVSHFSGHLSKVTAAQ